MKILVTGGGRIGSHLVRRLLEEGHTVRVFGLADQRMAALGDAGATVFEGDLTRPESLSGAVAGVDAVCHLAAALTTHDATDGTYLDVNVRGTFNLLEAVRFGAPGLQRFVYTSSDAVYYTTAESGDEQIDETTPLQPGTVYGATKVGAETLCRSFWRTYGVPFVVMRPTATADADELIRPDSPFGRRWFVRSAVEWFAARREPTAGESVLLAKLRELDDGTERLFTLVDESGTSSESTYGDARDAAAGMHALLAPDVAIGEAFNIGPAAPHRDRDLVEHIGRRLDLEVAEVRHRPVRPNWRVSTRRAQDEIGYRPEHSVFDMVDEAVAARTSGAPR